MNWSLPEWKKPKQLSKETMDAEAMYKASTQKGGLRRAKANRAAKAKQAIRRRNAEKRTT